MEKRRLVLGFVPLTDCAPVVAAVEKGFFSREGLEVSLSREASWANVRDKVATGALDGAQMLAGMPIASHLGIDPLARPAIAALSLGLNGNAITVSSELFEEMSLADPTAMAARPVSARALGRVLERRGTAARRPITLASVYPVSNHHYELRYWLAAGGIDPDRDVRLIVLPPPRMVENLALGRIDGFCVGEPWNTAAVLRRIGHIVATKVELWNNGPEKVFGVSREWAERHPRTLQALLRGLLLAAAWSDDPENRHELATLLSRRGHVDAPAEVIDASLSGSLVESAGGPRVSLPDFHVFYRYAATFPWLSHAAWIVAQMARWGQLALAPAAGSPGTGGMSLLEAAATAYRPDLYREAAAAVGIPFPTVDVKLEGTHAERWTLLDATSPIEMGPDRFFDGSRFDAERESERVRIVERPGPGASRAGTTDPAAHPMGTSQTSLLAEPAAPRRPARLDLPIP